MKKLFIVIVILASLRLTRAFALPVSYDLRDYGRVTSIKNQGIPGPCWSFAAITALESNYLTQKLNTNGKEPDLSELQIAYYCYKDPNPERNFNSKRTSGLLSLEGNIFMPVAFMARLSGPTDERFLQYKTNLSNSERAALSKKAPESYKRSMRLREAYYLSGNSTLNSDSLKELIMKHGAAAVSLYSDLNSYHVKGKYYTYYQPDKGTQINHLVAIAGWDDNFSRDNFTPKPKRDGAWLVKNSWGTLRGTNGGYFWMSYDQHFYGGAVLIADPNNNLRLKHYGYDDLGWCSNISYSWGANIFRTETNKERLKEVAFYTPSNNCSYEVYVYDLGNNKLKSPTAGKLLTSKQGKIEYAGYHTINLDESFTLNKDQHFSIVLKLSGSRQPVENVNKDYSENAVCHAGESYFSNDGKTWIDGINFKCNTCIKAFTLTR